MKGARPIHRPSTSLILVFLLVSGGSSGCIVPVSPVSSVHLNGYFFPVSVEQICWPEGSGIIHQGLHRCEVHEILAGLPLIDLSKSDRSAELRNRELYGPFVKPRWYLYLGAWEGPYSWGLHRSDGNYCIYVSYDDYEVVQSCELGGF